MVILYLAQVKPHLECSALGSTGQEREGASGEGPAEAKDGEGSGSSLSGGETVGAGPAQSREKKTAGISSIHASISKVDVKSIPPGA
ncbi:hypothetical protein DUI87_08654 [Hirundo rustica rustica]|uniref:Uncharacterized protein n=1 Tax=Hirundo rustica rustica TaxID=333673 RepID=A0A3M0KK03_HIRRU|nr:hypothetical protein DUI87_08654 [Hirundo rustica rustica]